MVTVDLFKECKCDNGGRMGNFTSLYEQTQYFNGLTGLHIQGTLSDDVGSLIVQQPWTTIIGYSYGRYQSNGVYIYFSIRDVEVVNPTKTRIIYDVDCWETCRFQTDMSLGRGIIRRSSRNLATATVRPFEPVFTRTTETQALSSTFTLAVYCYVHDSVNDTDTVYRRGDPETPGSGAVDVGTVIDGSWIKACGVASMNDVLGMWVSPWTDTSPGWTAVEGADHCFSKPVNEFVGNWIPEYSLTLGDVFGDQDSIVGITDLRGNLVWSCDMSDDLPSTLDCVMNISASTCNWVCQLGDSLESRFTIPCETVSLFNDAFTEYNYRQRAYDMEIRRISLDQQVTQGIGGLASSALGGAIGGSLVAPGLGTVVGAVGGMVSGLLGTVTTAVTQPTFDNRIQQATDAMYRRALDTQILIGDSISNILLGRNHVMQVSIETDSGTSTRYTDAVAAGGYYYPDLEVSDASDWIVDGPLCGDIEITGGIPSAWKEQIRNRFNNGVILS